MIIIRTAITMKIIFVRLRLIIIMTIEITITVETMIKTIIMEIIIPVKIIMNRK